MAIAIAGILGGGLVTTTGTAHATSPMDGLCTDLTTLARSTSAVTVGLVMVDLRSGDRCAVNADRPFRTASLYKTVVLAELYRQVQAGAVSLDDPLSIEPRHAIDDAPELRPKTAYTLSVYEAAEAMITYSSNGAAFALREMLGEDLVDQATRWLGMPATTLGKTFLSSPNDQAHLYSELFHGLVVDTTSSNAMLDILMRQEVADVIPTGVPRGTVVAHKTGTLDTFLHDAGIVYAPGGEFVLVILTEHTSYDAALTMGQEIASLAYGPYATANPPLLTDDAVMADLSSPGNPELAAAAAVVAGAPPTEGLRASGDGIQIQSPSAGEGAPTLVLGAVSETANSVTSALTDPLVLGALLALVGLAVAVPVLIRRRQTSEPPVRRHANLSPMAAARASSEGGARATVASALSYGVPVLSPESARSRADRSERGLVMRFGSRRDDDGRPNQMSPASRSVAEVAEQPVLPSKRLQRVAEHFRSQGELLSTMRDQFEEEMEPLHDLIVKQSQAMQMLLQSLEERLRPLNEYADGEEANLTALEERIQSGGQDHVARSFSQYMEEQRRRIGETRDQIDKQRLPFLEYGEAQRETVESALSRFDSDIEALEANLAEQRRVMVRMLDAMRSETFGAVKEYLDGRQQALAELAQSGATDPTEIGRAGSQLRREMEALAGKSDYVRALLQQAESADRILTDAAPSPRALRQDHVAAAESEADDESSEDEADVSA